MGHPSAAQLVGNYLDSLTIHMTRQNKFHLLAVAVCYKLSPSRIYSSSSSGIYKMRSPFILKLLCSLVEMMKSLFLRPEESRSSFSQFGCARRKRANWVQRQEEAQRSSSPWFCRTVKKKSSMMLALLCRLEGSSTSIN